MSYIKGAVEKLGHNIVVNLYELGKFTSFGLRFFYWTFRRPFRVRNIFSQFVFIGNKSLFIICLSGAFTGMVMAYQTYFGFKLINVDTLVGPIVSITLAKELGPVLTGLIVAGRAGAAMAAQIGSMKVTEQIDALEVMGINGIQYLATPRVISSCFALPILTAIFQFVGNVGSYFIGTKVLNIDEGIYFSKLSEFMYIEDMWQGLIKAFFFGFLISLIGTYFGFQVKRGAEGVGRGTNKAVVWGMINVLVWDYFLTSYLIKIL